MEQAQEATEVSSEVSDDTGSNDNQTQETSESQQQETAQRAGNPEREWVDPNIDPPEKVKERLDFLYGKVKKTERMESEWKKLAADQARVIEELQNGVGQVVNHLQQKNYADTEAQLEDQMVSALQTGDTRAYTTAQNKLIDIKTEKRLAQIRQPAQQQQQQNNPRLNSASQIGNASYEAGEIGYEDKTSIEAWQTERDERGGNLRPWAQNSGSEDDPDPDYTKALLIARKVFTAGEFGHLSTTQKLAEIDKRMGVKKPTGGQNVMGGTLTSKPRSGRITLSPQIEKMAIRTKFGGPKAKSDADHIDAYRKQIEKARSAKTGGQR